MWSTAVTHHPGSALKEMKLSLTLFQATRPFLMCLGLLHFSSFGLLLFTIMLFWISLNTFLATYSFKMISSRTWTKQRSWFSLHVVHSCPFFHYISLFGELYFLRSLLLCYPTTLKSFYMSAKYISSKNDLTWTSLKVQ